MARRGAGRGTGSRRPLMAGVAVGVACLVLAAVFARRLANDPEPDRTTVKGAFAAFVAIQDKGNFEALYPMIAKETRDQIAETFSNIRKAAEIIERTYPHALKSQALADLGPEEVRNARDPAHYLAARIGASGRVGASVQQKLSSRLKRIEEKPEGSGRFVVTTVSGASLEFVRGGDGLFQLVMDPDDVQQIHYEYLKSIEALNAATKAARTFGESPLR